MSTNDKNYDASFNKRLTNAEEIDIYTAIMQNLSDINSIFFKYNASNSTDVDSLIDSGVLYVLKNIRIIIEALKKIGINPDAIFHIFLKSNRDKIWKDGKIHYDKEKGEIIPPAGWPLPYDAIRKELFLAEQSNYTFDEPDILNYFKEIKQLFESAQIIVSDKQTPINSNDVIIRGSSMVTDFGNSNDLLDEVYFLGKMLFYYLSVLVKSGIKLENYIQMYNDDSQRKSR